MLFSVLIQNAYCVQPQFRMLRPELYLTERFSAPEWALFGLDYRNDTTCTTRAMTSPVQLYPERRHCSELSQDVANSNGRTFRYLLEAERLPVLDDD